MRPTALLVWAFLLPCILGKDHDGLPKLSNEHLNQTVVKSVVTTVEAEQTPQRTRRSEVFPRLDYKDNVALKWVQWSGSLPQWAVKVYIPGTGRQDYICAPHTGCHWTTGYYNPSKGSFCFNPCNGKEVKDSEFDILVNEQNVELLEWKAFEGDIDNAVTSRIPDKTAICVGKGYYGIGSILHSILYLPMAREEHYFQNDYLSFKGFWHTFFVFDLYYDPSIEILTLQTGRYNQKIYDVEYEVDELSMRSQKPTTFNEMSVMNKNCRQVTQLVQLQESIESQSTWGNSVSNTLAVSASMTVNVPYFSATGGVEYSKSRTITNGNSLIETISYSLSVTVTVPPNHSCLVKMAGKRFQFDVPYKAHLSKEYTNGKAHSTTMSGTYHGVQVGEIHAVAERCVPIPNAQPCTR